MDLLQRLVRHGRKEHPAGTRLAAIVVEAIVFVVAIPALLCWLSTFGGERSRFGAPQSILVLPGCGGARSIPQPLDCLGAVSPRPRHTCSDHGNQEVVNEWSSDDRQQIELQYPGGEEGELWVYQLMDWLVALGIPSNNLVAVPGSGQEDVIRLRVIRSGENFR